MVRAPTPLPRLALNQPGFSGPLVVAVYKIFSGAQPGYPSSPFPPTSSPKKNHFPPQTTLPPFSRVFSSLPFPFEESSFCFFERISGGFSSEAFSAHHHNARIAAPHRPGALTTKRPNTTQHETRSSDSASGLLFSASSGSAFLRRVRNHIDFLFATCAFRSRFTSSDPVPLRVRLQRR